MSMVSNERILVDTNILFYETGLNFIFSEERLSR